MPFLSFGAPLALLALLGLPVIWWVLRATPPKPQRETLPSFRLLAGLVDKENEPRKTPWWLMLLRLILVGLMILALSLPSQKAPQSDLGNVDSVLFVVDDGWTSAPQWQDMKAAMLAQLEAFPQSTSVHFLLTSAKTLQTQPSETFPTRQARAIVQTLKPVGWLPDRGDALARLQAANIAPDRIYWFSDGLVSRQMSGSAAQDAGGARGENTDLTHAAFIDALSGSEAPKVFLPKPTSILRIIAAQFEAGQYDVTVQLNPLAVGMPLTQTSVTALTSAGFSLATSQITFDVASGTGRAVFDLPFTTAQRVSRFRVNSGASAGNTWLTRLNDGPKYVGLVQETQPPQPLLTDAHYIENALSDNVTLRKASVAELMVSPPSVVVLADGLRPTKTEEEALLEWIREGGVLVRFATEDMGETLARDRLVAVPLRRTARNLGSALNWDTPQPIAAFGVNTPFYNLEIDADTRITRQVLARASADLARQTWAALADGSPLVTTRKLGEGRIVFFHVGATPDWSNLVLSPLFPDLWERILGLAKSGVAPQTGAGQYTPSLVLDGFGAFTNPPDTSAPLDFLSLDSAPVSQTHPAGYYRGPSGQFARNAGLGVSIAPIDTWPEGSVFIAGFGGAGLSLTTLFFLAGFAFLVIECLVFAFYLMRPSPRFRARHAGLALVLLVGFSVLPLVSLAQSQPPSAQDETNLEAAMGIRFAYIPSGQTRLDTQVERGLVGLTRILFLRTSVEPEAPHRLNLKTDALELYPLIYWAMPDVPQALAPEVSAKLNAYMRSGGAVVVDTRSGDMPGGGLPQERLAVMLAGVDVPPLARVPSDHVINRAFYLISDYPGRYENDALWVEATQANAEASGVSRIIIGDADWASAWATDTRGRSMASVDGGQRGREFAYRFGVNLVMYVLTGSYKSDQVHLPALIERLGDEAGDVRPLLDDAPTARDGVDLE